MFVGGFIRLSVLVMKPQKKLKS